MVNGEWMVEPPKAMEAEFGKTTKFKSLGDIFDVETRGASPAGKKYQEYIKKTLERLITKEGKQFGALIMEVRLIIPNVQILCTDKMLTACYPRSRRDAFRVSRSCPFFPKVLAQS
jgi:dethiobiotin synthetase/adenosylmethionine--8-amino-7-oxononanoate aminotransferase